MRSRPSTPGRTRCAISKARSPRSSPRSAPAAPASPARCSARASTASCSPPPRPIICITPPRPAGALPRAHHRARDRTREVHRRRGRRGRARGGAGDARGDRRARARQAPGHHRHAACGRDDRRRTLRRRRPRSRPFRATCRTIPAALFAGFTGLTAADETDYRFLRFRPPLIEHGRPAPPALPHIRLDRALQFLLGDRLA